MRIMTSAASPFGAKVAMAAQFAKFDVELVEADATNQAPDLLAANPLGKIPTLVLDDGTVLYDSRTITRYLDQQSNGALGMSDGSISAAFGEAHWDGVSEAAVACMYEQRFRPEDKWHQPWLDRQWGKVERGLDNPPGGKLPESGDDLTMSGIALGAALGYLSLRFGGRWEEGRDDLVAWFDAFQTAHPDLANHLPNAG